MTKPEVWRALDGSQQIALGYDEVFELLYHGTRGPGKSDTLLMMFATKTGLGYGADWRWHHLQTDL